MCSGIGLGIVRALLARSNTTVITSVRNAGSVESLRSELSTVEKGAESNFVIVTLDLDAFSTPEKVREHFNAEIRDAIQHIDVLISNAAQATSMGNSLETTALELRSHFETNSIAPLILFQALWPLMKRSEADASVNPPKLLMISSSVGSIEMQEPLPGGAYGPSKAALNWITKRLHLELESDGLVSVAVHPGYSNYFSSITIYLTNVTDGCKPEWDHLLRRLGTFPTLRH